MGERAASRRRQKRGVSLSGTKRRLHGVGAQGRSVCPGLTPRACLLSPCFLPENVLRGRFLSTLWWTERRSAGTERESFSGDMV